MYFLIEGSPTGILVKDSGQERWLDLYIVKLLIYRHLGGVLYWEGGSSVEQCTVTLAHMVACLPLVQQVRGSIPGGVVHFYLKIFNLGARRGGDVHLLIARLYITVLD